MLEKRGDAMARPANEPLAGARGEWAGRESTMADDKAMTRREISEKITALAWKDEAFRKAFLADPKKQFEERLQTKLPAGLTITAVAEDENHLHFVIPAKPANSTELSDSDLEKVAGGIDVITTAFVVTSATLVSGAVAASVNAIVLQASDSKAGWTGK
jgi:hypothetical protein